MLVAESFLRSLIKIYGKHTVYSDGESWYPEVCSYPGLKHLIHSPFEKGIVERTIEYLKNRTEAFYDYYPMYQIWNLILDTFIHPINHVIIDSFTILCRLEINHASSILSSSNITLYGGLILWNSNNLVFSTLIIAFVILVVVVISSLSITFALQIKPLQNDESAFPPLNNIEINSDSIKDLISYGNTSVREGKYEEAIQYYDQALAIDTKFVQALRGEVVALSALGRYEEAIQYSDKALTIDLNNVRAITNKGLVLNQLGRYEEAIQYSDKALAMDPNYAGALNNKGHDF